MDSAVRLALLLMLLMRTSVARHLQQVSWAIACCHGTGRLKYQTQVYRSIAAAPQTWLHAQLWKQQLHHYYQQKQQQQQQ
jgi:hypothetical protein